LKFKIRFLLNIMNIEREFVSAKELSDHDFRQKFQSTLQTVRTNREFYFSHARRVFKETAATILLKIASRQGEKLTLTPSKLWDKFDVLLCDYVVSHPFEFAVRENYPFLDLICNLRILYDSPEFRNNVYYVMEKNEGSEQYIANILDMKETSAFAKEITNGKIASWTKSSKRIICSQCQVSNNRTFMDVVWLLVNHYDVTHDTFTISNDEIATELSEREDKKKLKKEKYLALIPASLSPRHITAGFQSKLTDFKKYGTVRLSYKFWQQLFRACIADAYQAVGRKDFYPTLMHDVYSNKKTRLSVGIDNFWRYITKSSSFPFIIAKKEIMLAVHEHIKKTLDTLPEKHPCFDHVKTAIAPDRKKLKCLKISNKTRYHLDKYLFRSGLMNAFNSGYEVPTPVNLFIKLNQIGIINL
jgi:hypothetical protein